MTWILAAHAVLALLAPGLVRLLGRRAFLVLAAAPAATLAWALANTGAVLAAAEGSGPEVRQAVAWVPEISLALDVRLDSLSWLMTLLVGGIGALVLAYCAGYFSADSRNLGRFAGVFVGFAAAMAGLVTADNVLSLYLFWELTTVFSYLLIGHYFERTGSRRAAMQAVVVTTLGGLAMLAGLVVLAEHAGTYSLSGLVAAAPRDGPVAVAIVLVLVGAASKSALIPFHFWLPAAMAAPTPVSAYLHAAAMVKAGVYLVARLSPGFAEVPAWRWTVLLLGSGTMLLGGYRALRQHDLKLLLAFGTVSQLGFLILVFGLGNRAVGLGALALLGAHALFKAALFLVVGLIDDVAGTRDLRELSGLGRRLPITAAMAALAVASMVGLAPFAGFVGKEAVLEGLWHSGEGVDRALFAVVVLGSVLTTAYGLRFWWGAFARKPGVKPSTAPGPSPLLAVPPAALALGGLGAGLVPGLGERLLGPYAASLPFGEPGHLVLWAGVGPALLASVAILSLGLALFVGREGFAQAQARVPVVPDADLAYRRSMRLLDRIAGSVTAVTQRGSLPVYLAVILVAMVAFAVGTVLIGGVRLPPVRPYDHVLQALVGAAVAVAALLAVRARRRLKAVLLAGAGGYGVAVLFALHGAPDLALTQVLVETITLVVFVLVLRRLPPYFSNRPFGADRRWRIWLGVVVGVTAAGLTLLAPAARQHAPVSVDFPAEAYNFGHGRNVVNVTIVDIRAWDTMGEIAVLLAAATGVASLVFVSTRGRPITRVNAAAPRRAVWSGGAGSPGEIRRMSRLAVPEGGWAPERGRPWLRAAGTVAPHRRSVILEVATRLIFHTMVVFALFLLFSGHNAPGGGFAAGLVTGIALAVRYLGGGRYELSEAAPVQPGVLLGAGLFLSVGAGIVPLLFGEAMLQSYLLEIALGPLGTVKLVTSLFFDVGVYLLVIGVVLDILRSLGAEVDRQGEEAGQAVPDVPYDSPLVTRDDLPATPGVPL